MGVMLGTQDALLADASEVIEKAFNARSHAELDALMAQALARFGITHFSLDQMLDSSGAMVALHHCGKWPEDWGAHYIEQAHYRHDKVVRHALVSPSPLRWVDAEAGALKPQERRLFGEAREFGIRDGFVTPVHLFDGSLYSVAVHSPNKLELSTADKTVIRLISLNYCSFGLRLKSAVAKGPVIVLTDRQRECLQWVRAGKSSWEIGEILGISERTVNFHVELAMRRLNVQTRHQAVIEAIVQKLIAI